MTLQRLLAVCACAAGLAMPVTLPAQTITVKAGDAGIPIQPTMYGIFFEDINFAADGGIYAELVKNRSFEFDAPLMGWKVLHEEGANGSVLVVNREAVNSRNPRYIKVDMKAGKGRFGIANEGFRGMGIKEGEQYNFSVMARLGQSSKVALRLELVNGAGKVIGHGSVTPGDLAWKTYTTSFTATETADKGHLNVYFTGIGTIDLDMISLFPQHTWKQRPQGLRADLVQLLADMKPGFVRFPGGCIVEGRTLDVRYQWKKTVGDIADRQMIVNRWNTEFSHRSTPDYFQSFGLGFYEYFLLSEDIGARPLPILNCGMACQYNTGEVVAMDELDPYLQDALDLVEFANGPVSSKWGALRASMGHPQPFGLTMIGIGNEQWGEQYVERYKVFAKAFHDKYPDIKLVGSVGPSPGGDQFNYLNDTMRALQADLLDEHYYCPPDWFLSNARRYDNYDRNSSKVFAGEYASHDRDVPNGPHRNNWLAALSEAAYMTGLERNADVVYMTSYAPLFAHVDAWQWTPDLIWFDNLHSYGTPNYYVQKLYANNRGTRELPMLEADSVLAGQDSLYAAAAIDDSTHELILKLVNVSGEEKSRTIQLDGIKKLNTTATLEVMQSDDLKLYNSFDSPKAMSPREEEMAVKGKKITMKLEPHSFVVLKIKLK